ncbi:MAG: TlpA disulfide reductase family protein [Nocardioidaceae bacterium]
MTLARRARLALAVLLLLVPVAGCGDKPAPKSQALPSVTLEPLGDGTAVDLATLRGPLVINIWASWCPPCRKELPIYQRFAKAASGRVDVLGIDFNDPQAQKALQLARDSGVTYPLLADPETTVDGRGPIPVLRGLPALVLVDAQGHVVHLEYVEITSLDQLEQLVTEHLGVDL